MHGPVPRTPAALRAETGFEVFDPEPGQTVTMLHDHHCRRRVRQNPPNLGRFRFSPDPTSRTTSPTSYPFVVAHEVSRATCLSRSER